MIETEKNSILLDVLKKLEELSEDQKLIEQTFACCKTGLANCIEEDLEIGIEPLRGWKLDEIKIVFEKQALIFKHGTLSYPYIDTQLGLYVHIPESDYWDDLYQIGTYRLITHPDGTIDDDYLVIDERSGDI